MYFQQIFLIILEVHKGPCCVFVGIGNRICYNTALSVDILVISTICIVIMLRTNICAG